MGAMPSAGEKPSPMILTINAGSSSIKFALYDTVTTLRQTLCGKIDRIGPGNAVFSIHDSPGKPQSNRRIRANDHRTAAEFLLHWLESQPAFAAVSAIGHRVVHGMTYSVPQRVNGALLAELSRIAAYDPDHLPHEIQLIEAFRKRHPKLPQIACFDTAFHRDMPPVAKLLPIPRRYTRHGVRRYGFHGLSYGFLLEELARLGDTAAKRGRVILAHLGNGASLAAVRNGKSVDTSMGFTPASGLVMSTRSGDLDPGVFCYLARMEGMTAAQFQKMVKH